jgi:hypothetical protein
MVELRVFLVGTGRGDDDRGEPDSAQAPGINRWLRKTMNDGVGKFVGDSEVDIYVEVDYS